MLFFGWKGLIAAALDVEGAEVGFPGEEAPGTFYRCRLRSRALVALISLMLISNCWINHGQEHQEHAESVFLVGGKKAKE